LPLAVKDVLPRDLRFEDAGKFRTTLQRHCCAAAVGRRRGRARQNQHG
jgi:hypothetical protein